jgi:hypothetical protein
MDFRSFLLVCTSYKSTFPNRSDNTWRHPRLHILSPFPPFFVLPATYFPCRMTAQTCQPTQSRASLRRQHACSHETVFWKIFHMFRPLPDRVCVCVHRRVVTYSGHFLLRYSHDTFFYNVLNARRRLRPLTCVFAQPPRDYIFRTFPSSLLQHIPSHTSALSPTHSFSHICTLSNTFLLTHLYSLQHPLLLMLALSLLWSSFSLYQKITPYIRFRDW